MIIIINLKKSFLQRPNSQIKKTETTMPSSNRVFGQLQPQPQQPDEEEEFEEMDDFNYDDNDLMILEEH